MSCKLQFQIHYYTKTGENLYLKIGGSINEEIKYLPLNYLGDGFWGNSFDFSEENLDFQYSYVVRDNLLHNKKDEGVLQRSFLRRDVSSDYFFIRDFWMDKGRAENAFFTDAFAGLVLPQTSQFPETLNVPLGAVNVPLESVTFVVVTVPAAPVNVPPETVKPPFNVWVAELAK